MAKNYELKSYGQSVFKEIGDRQFEIIFSEPEKGVNEETGILLLIAGYGANLKSNIYVKMRENFADKFNFITVQCNYLGQEFMQSNTKATIDSKELKQYLTEEEYIVYTANPEYYIEQVANKYDIVVNAKAVINENKSNLNDMGPMQAIDNLTAIKVVMDILEENKLKYNKNKVVTYGHSHGAYLSYLCNAFSPNLISTIIDNSAYLYPRYLDKERTLYDNIGKMTLDIKFDYLIKQIVLDKEIYDLNKMYSSFNNNARVICFQGNNDFMITSKEKKEFINLINNGTIEVIDDDRVDADIFKNCNHGLGADFIKLFEYVHEKYGFDYENKQCVYEDIEYKTCKYTYTISYKSGIPTLDMEVV